MDYAKEKEVLISKFQRTGGFLKISITGRNHQAYRGQGSINFHLLEHTDGKYYCANHETHGQEPDGYGGNLPSGQHDNIEGDRNINISPSDIVIYKAEHTIYDNMTNVCHYGICQGEIDVYLSEEEYEELEDRHSEMKKPSFERILSDTYSLYSYPFNSETWDFKDGKYPFNCLKKEVEKVENCPFLAIAKEDKSFGCFQGVFPREKVTYEEMEDLERWNDSTVIFTLAGRKIEGKEKNDLLAQNDKASKS